MAAPETATATATIEDELARLADLDDTALQALRTRILAEFDAADTADDIVRMGQLAGHIDTYGAEVTRRETAAAAAPAEPPAAQTPPAPAEAPATQAPVATGAEETQPSSTVPGENPAADAPETAATTTPPEDAPAETPEAQEGTTVAAAGSTVAVPRGSEPVVASAPGSRVFAGADIPGFPAGHEFTSGEEFALALSKRINTLSSLRGGDGEQVVIASIVADPVDDSRVLSFNDPSRNMSKIQEVIAPEAITAAGGCCAPLVTRYDLFDCGGVTDRPVKDSLPSFRAERGGIRFWRGPALADLQGALGFWTCADDAAADANDPDTWKVCARIDCPPEETAELQAITLCLTFGVLQTRVFPELAVANNRLALVAQARLAESAILAQIKAGSTAVTDGGTPLSAVRDVLSVIGRAAMYFRDRYRIRSTPLRAIMPSWVIELLRGDLILGPESGRAPGDFFGVSEDEVRGFFSSRNINVTWALDSAVPGTLGGGFYNAISGAALPAWPTTVEWALFPEGTWLALDGGTLDLGIIRDSTLVRVNDYMTFSESWEAAVNIGCESLWITSTVSVSGKAQGPVAG